MDMDTCTHICQVRVQPGVKVISRSRRSRPSTITVHVLVCVDGTCKQYNGWIIPSYVTLINIHGIPIEFYLYVSIQNSHTECSRYLFHVPYVSFIIALSIPYAVFMMYPLHTYTQCPRRQRWTLLTYQDRLWWAIDIYDTMKITFLEFSRTENIYPNDEVTCPQNNLSFVL